VNITASVSIVRKDKKERASKERHDTDPPPPVFLVDNASLSSIDEDWQIQTRTNKFQRVQSIECERNKESKVGTAASL
jgi:hypothetical protein